jgi:alpha,alpha-trehalose phosphorylase
VILQDAFTVEPWNLRETHLDLDLLAQTESVFALANGHVGWRANLDEGERHGLPGSYLNGVWESRPLPYAESAYGLPETGQEIINVTNGKLIGLFADDEPFDVRSGQLRSHERLLDFRAGVLSRRAEWVSPAGRPVRVSSVRLVSFTQRAVAAICYEVEPVDGQARIAVQSELLTSEQLPSAGADPRVAAALQDPLSGGYCDATGTAVILVHRTKRSGLRVGAAMEHRIDCPAPVRAESRSFTDGGVVTAAAVLAPGQKLRVVKFVACAWSGARSLTGVGDQVWAALTAARQAGWDGLLAGQHRYLDDFWDRADVEVDGDPEVQQAVRFALFHVLQASARAENRAIPAKGLTGARVQHLHEPDGPAEPGLRRGPDHEAARSGGGAWRDHRGGGVVARRGERDVHPVRRALGVHPQHEGFTSYARWDFNNTPEDRYPLLRHYPYFQLYRK